jgi:hypothetical protein
MKKIAIIFFTILCSINTFSQVLKDTTSFENYKSTYGTLEREVRYKFPDLMSGLGATNYVKSYLKAIKIQNDVTFYFGITLVYSKSPADLKLPTGGSLSYNTWNFRTVFLTYEQLKEIINVCNIINTKSTNDLTKKYEYVDNRLVLADDLIFGCEVENQTLNWYFRSDDFGISRYDFSNYEQVMKFFNRAKEKMEQLGVK